MQKDDLKRLLARRQEKQRHLLQHVELFPDSYNKPLEDNMQSTFAPEATPQLSQIHSQQSIIAWQRKQYQQVESTKNDLREKIHWLNETRDNILKEKERLQKLKVKIQTRPLSPPFVDTPLDPFQRDKLLEKWEFHRHKNVVLFPATEEQQDVADIISQVKQTLASREEEYRSKRNAFLRTRETEAGHLLNAVDLSSYSPKQLALYSWCRGLLTQIVENVMDRSLVIPSTSARNGIRDQLSRERHHILSEEAALLICEEILLEFLYDECHLTSLEMNYCNKLSFNMAHNTVLKESEIIASRSEAGRRALYFNDESNASQEDAMAEYKRTAERMRYFLYEFRKKRNSKSSDSQWCHQQQVKDLTETVTVVATKSAPAQIIVIDFSDLHPVSMLNSSPLPTDTEEVSREIEDRNQFMELERQCWAAMKVSDFSVQMSMEYVGKSCLSVARNNRLVAVGTVSGHVLVHQLLPPTYALLSRVLPLVQVIQPPTYTTVQKKGLLHQKSVNHVEFSHCCNLLAAVYDSGEVIIHRLSEDTSAPTFKYLHLLKKSGSFSLSSNTLLRGDQLMKLQSTWSPIFLLFNEDLDILLEPRSIYIGMDSFDVLWVELFEEPAASEVSPTRLTEPNIPVHKLGDSATGVSFRTHIYHFHNSPIVLATVINARGDLLTLDMEGIGALWILRKDYLSSSGWLAPWKQFTIKLETTRYFEDAVEAPKVFYDAAWYNKGKARVTKEETAQKEMTRMAAESEIARLGLRHPWIRRRPTWKLPIELFIYRETKERVTESGAVFHEVGRNINTGELVSYQQVIYRAFPFACSRFLGCSYCRETSKLAVALLYKEYEPYYSACVEVVIISIPLMKAIFPRIQVMLTKEEHSRLLVQEEFSLCLTTPLVPTGADYVVFNILGRMEMVSLLTGQYVMCKLTEQLRKLQALQQKAIQRGEQFQSLGLVLEQERYAFTGNTLIHCMNLEQTLTLLCHTQGGLSLRLLQFQENSSSELRQQLQQYLSSWKKELPKGIDVAAKDTYIGLDPLDSSSDGIVHTEAAVREIIYDVMDVAIQQSLGKFNTEREEQVQNSNRYHAYASAAGETQSAI